jgi:integrase
MVTSERRQLDLKSIQVRLGHSSIRVTGDRYAHLLSAVEDRSVLALDALASRVAGE